MRSYCIQNGKIMVGHAGQSMFGDRDEYAYSVPLEREMKKDDIVLFSASQEAYKARSSGRPVTYRVVLARDLLTQEGLSLGEFYFVGERTKRVRRILGGNFEDWRKRPQVLVGREFAPRLRW